MPALLFAVAASGFTPAAQAQNIDAGKPAAKLFSDSCSTCHRSPRGLAKGRFSLTLQWFLRDHYVTGPESAKALAECLGEASIRHPLPPSHAAKPKAKQGGAPKSETEAACGNAGAVMLVISIQSQVVHGHVGNSAAVYPMQAEGVSVAAVPITLLSNHPRYPTVRGRVLDAELVADLLRGVEERGLIDQARVARHRLSRLFLPTPKSLPTSSRVRVRKTPI